MVRYLIVIFMAFLYIFNGQSVTAQEIRGSHSSVSIDYEFLDISMKQVGIKYTFNLKDGYHSYWTNPGMAGGRADINISPINLITPVWEGYDFPKVMSEAGVTVYGYDTPYSIYQKINLAEPGVETVIDVALEWLVCNASCIPQSGSGKIIINPQMLLDKGIFLDIARISKKDSQLHLKEDSRGKFIDVSSIKGNISDAVFIYASNKNVKDISAVSYDVNSKKLYLNKLRYAPVIKGILQYTADNIKNNLNVEIINNLPDEPLEGDQPTNIIALVIMAFLGGAILNLMPCVFPVIFLKAYSVTKLATENFNQRAIDAFAYTGGIVCSFTVLAVIISAMQSTGESVGWGFQLQNPYFVIVMINVVLLMAFSLFGFLLFRTGLESLGSEATRENSLKGSFLTGVLAAVIASPCTAPLMAPAVGFAFTQSFGVMLMIFISLALGMAIPYVLISLSSTIAKALPKPGAWMEKLKVGLGFPMLLTAVWLLYVLGAITSSDTMTIVLAVTIIFIFIGWIFKAFNLDNKVVLGSLFALCIFIQAHSVTYTAEVNGGEIEGSLDMITDIQNSDEPAFIYFTADWCITCKVNEYNVIHDDEMQKFFSQNNIKIIKIDWTNKDEKIAQYLKKYKRAGVPLYMVFRQEIQEMKILPEVLSKKEVMEAYKKTKGEA